MIEKRIYNFFELADTKGSAILVRAVRDREINRKLKRKQKLWEVVKNYQCSGKITVEIPGRDNKPKRTAHLEVRFGKFMMSPSRNNIRRKTEILQDLPMYVVHVLEKNQPTEITPLEWMLLTNIPVDSFEEAIEKVKWYCLRWRIEVFHKILKSGLKVEECRLGSGKRLIKYLTVMSIIAWRIFFITLIARGSPDIPCTVLLTEEEWRILYVKMHKIAPPDNTIPTIKDAVIWIARLGGYLARKNDPDPGPIVLWKV